MRLLASDSICYIIAEGGKAHTCQMQLWCKTHTYPCARTSERSHKHSRHFITGESGRNESVQRICHKARARRRRNRSHISYSNIDCALSGASCVANLPIYACKYFNNSTVQITKEVERQRKEKKKNCKSALNIKQFHLWGNLFAQQSTAASFNIQISFKIMSWKESCSSLSPGRSL